MENPFSSILASTARGRSDSVATAPTRVGAENSAAAANIPSSRSSDALSSLGLEGTPSKGISSAGGSSCSSSSSSSSSNNNSNVRSGMGKIGSPGGAPAPVPSSSAKKGLSRPSSFRMMDSPAPKTPQKPSANADSAAASALGRCRSTSKETRDQARGLPASLGLTQTSLTVKTAPVCKTLDRAFRAKNGHGVGPLPPQPPNKTVILAKQRAAVRKIRTQKDSIGFTAPAAASEEEVALARRRQSMAITSEIKTLVQRAEEEQALELGLEEAEVGVEVGDVEQSGGGGSSDAVQGEAGGGKVIIAADAIAGVSPSRLSAVAVPRSSDSKSRPRISSDDATGRKRESLLQDSALISKMLPRKVCLHVREGKPVPPEFFSNVSIFFSDVVGFTNISAAVEPIHVIRLLNTLFTVMDYVTSLFPLYKVETIGDAYMVASGLPEPNPENCQALADFAILVSHAVSVVRSPLDRSPIRIRMGMHSGDVMAGVVGSMMPRYCLFGDTVNTASRMESNGEPGRIHISEAIARQLIDGGRHVVEERGEIEVKGKGVMRTFWLSGACEATNTVSSVAAISRVVSFSRDLVAASYDFGLDEA